MWGYYGFFYYALAWTGQSTLLKEVDNVFAPVMPSFPAYNFATPRYRFSTDS